MRPPASTLLSKLGYSNLIVIAGLLSGILITVSIWLDLSNQFIAFLSLFSLGLIGLGSFLFVRRPLTSRPRWVTILAALAAVSLVYLFPELFGPTCGGMPRAFASPLTRCGTCLEFVCEWNYKKHKEWCYCNKWDLSGCPTQPPTIEAELTCSQWGQNEWCAGSYLLGLTATEPQGQNVMISGSIEGTPFACPASPSTSTCSVPLPEGSGTATFTATSATGLTTSGSVSFKHDSTPPQINGSLNGTTGSNGWFISPVEASASATDPLPGSGFADFSYDLNGSGWESYSGLLSLSGGVHSLTLRASDEAGNTAETVQTVRVDTSTPTLDLSLTGTTGTNSWYRSKVLVSATTSDAGSGLDAFEYDLDGAGWVSYTTPLELSDGIHNLSIRSVDVAGNNTTWAQSFQVDTIAPVLDMTLTGSLASSGWYTSSVQISLSAYDPGSVSSGISGLSTLEYNLDGAGWTTYSTPLELGDGLHTVEVRATDNAGNITSGTQSFPVDTAPPMLDITVSGTQGNSPWYISFVQVAALASDATSDLTSLEVKVDGGEWSTYNTPLVFVDGFHTYHFRARDNAGNITTSALESLHVDTIPPAISLPASWKLGNTVAFELHDGGSGLASVRLVIEDEDERYAKVTWQKALASYDYDGDINWNGRFKDGVLAHPGGEYYATLKVKDNAGNETHKPGQINVPIVSYLETLTDSSDNLVNGAGSDLIVTQILDFFDETDPNNSPVENTPSTLSFGGGNNNGLPSEQTGLNLGGGNNGLAQPTDAQTGKLTFDAGGRSSSPVPIGSSDLMMGATAAAAIGAFAAEITRRKEEAAEIARKKAEELAAKRAANAKTNQRRKRNIAAYQAAINNFKATLNKAREMGMSETQASRLKNTVLKTGKIGAALGTAVGFVTREAAKSYARKKTAGIARVITKEEKIEAEMRAYGNQPQELGESYNQYMAQKAYEIYRAGEIAAHTKITQLKNENSWWETTKYFVSGNILQPLNTYVYQPYMENIYHPYISPLMERAAEEISKGIKWLNESIYLPHIKPKVEKYKEVASQHIEWVNENIYQPHIQPILAVINEKFYQPYIEPVTKVINQYLYQPYINFITPLVEKGTDLWNQYGEWVHTALDAVGFIPGVGEIADGINGLIYLAEGRYIEASLSAVAMIPVLGDLGKAGKLGLKVGKELVEEAAEKVVKEGSELIIEKIAKEGGEELAEKVTKESAEQIAEKTAKEAGEGLSGQVAKKTIKETSASKMDEVIAGGAQKGLEYLGNIPGLNELSKVGDALINLRKGEFFDAGVSLVSMVPVIGDKAATALGVMKSTKILWGNAVTGAAKGTFEALTGKLAKESAEHVAKETSEEVGTKLVRETAEEVTEKVVQESGEVLEKALIETAEETTEKLVKETKETIIEKTTKETSEAATEKSMKEAGEEAMETVTGKTVKEAADESATKTVKDASSASPKKSGSKNHSEEITEDVKERFEEDTTEEESAEGTSKLVDEETAKFVQGLRDKYGDKMVESFIPFCEKHGIDPKEILTRPPAEGQTLIGWGLGIDSPANPVNHPLLNLNLTKEEINKIMEKSLKNPNSKVVCLGYGGGVEKPYYKLGEEIDGCYISISNEDWTPFNDARANFWIDLNAPFIEKSIEERKIFIFNVNRKTIIDKENIERFSLPELRLIEMPNNNYVRIEFGKYEFMVPKEFEDTFIDHLPDKLKTEIMGAL